ncbi:polysaccharide deacetylase [Nakamurella sp. YIM 132087]|uniref:Polysaccharide deacetylase n=1 Tax=Nakamurella alba TaxID=2665158 RepID=A0A7K1FS32_9ACTN|nr:polysaccharide deacetylase [Nakamurella alba]MTD16957.1 polysaccharide deacetylase [Nakamurella alba]
MTKLKPGDTPPQFIIFSFDGAGSHEKWQEFMAAAEKTDSRFNGFLTGLYLLTDENADRYTGPGHAQGSSSVGFGGTGEEVATLIEDLNEAYSRGHEIGTHYNGHFCSGAEPSGSVWTTADWNNELDQFFGFLENYKQNNPGVTLPDLTVPLDTIKGGRTQCLEGIWQQLVPAWKEHGFTYDSSMNSPTSGISWPVLRDGIWEFYMPYVYSPGFDGMVINMDYNMWVKYNGGANEPGTEADLRQKVYETYQFLYDEAYAGNRAPILVANHFNNWNGNSFNPAVLQFMENYCGEPDTYCTTYSDVIAWMELQDPAVLDEILNQGSVAAEAP